MIIGFILLVICLLRVPSALISAHNEKQIKARGGIEYGTTNSKLLIIVQGFIYLSCIVFAFVNDVQFNALTIAGLLVYAFSMASLVYVIRTLGPFWTFKLYIAKDHKLVQSPLFKHIRHPNYYMNIIPELIAFALISQAWIVFTPLFVLHLLTLFNRIALEEKVMKETFRQY